MKTIPLTIEDFIAFTDKLADIFDSRAATCLSQRNYDGYSSWLQAKAIVSGTSIRGFNVLPGSTGVREEGLERVSDSGETPSVAVGEVPDSTG